ncbi:fucolectin-like [Discoglossus pictus]
MIDNYRYLLIGIISFTVLHHGLIGVSAVSNVALQGLALQSSSILGQGEAHLSIDGNTNPDYSQGSCSRTTYQYNPWWGVDLRRGYLINSVTITNQASSTTTSVPWGEIRVGAAMEELFSNGRCATIISMAPGQTLTFPCGGVYGQYVIVIRPNRYDVLTICEVQVEVTPIPDLHLGLMIKTVSEAGGKDLQDPEMIRQQVQGDTRRKGREISPTSHRLTDIIL